MSLPFDPAEEVAELGQGMLQPFPVDAYPNLVAYHRRAHDSPATTTATSSSTGWT